MHLTGSIPVKVVNQQTSLGHDGKSYHAPVTQAVVYIQAVHVRCSQSEIHVELPRMNKKGIQGQERKVSGEALGPGQFGLSTGIDPMYRGPASLEAVSESSESAAQSALQGLTCD